MGYTNSGGSGEWWIYRGVLGAQAPTPGNMLMALAGVLAEDADDRMHSTCGTKVHVAQSSNDN